MRSWMAALLIGYAAAVSGQDRVRTPITFPIRTPEMTPGTVTARHIDLPHLARPLFLIGDDNDSIDWLIRHRDRLSQLHAIGLLVGVDGVDGLWRIAQAGQGLPIAPAPAGEIANQFSSRHYPVLISSQGIEP